MSYVPKLERYPNWYELRIMDYLEKVAPKPVWTAYIAVCKALNTTPYYMHFETRRDILKALGALWERSATEEEIDHLHYYAAVYWGFREEQDRRTEAEERERKRQEENARAQAWYESKMREREEERERERAAAEAAAKKGRKK